MWHVVLYENNKDQEKLLMASTEGDVAQLFASNFADHHGFEKQSEETWINKNTFSTLRLYFLNTEIPNTPEGI